MNDAQPIRPERLLRALKPLKILGVGHSHLIALTHGFAARKADKKAWPRTQFFKMQLREDVFQPNFSDDDQNAELNEIIVRRFKSYLDRHCPSLIVFVLMGNEYNAIGMLNHPQRFDFYAPMDGSTPDRSAQLLPYNLLADLIRRRLSNTLGCFFEALAHLAPGKIVHVPPPPPVPDADHISSFPGAFKKRVADFGVSPAPFRRKLWRLSCAVQLELCKQHGVKFLELPASVFDSDGFLAQPYWNRDPSHGNQDYGRVLADWLTNVADAMKRNVH